MAKIFELAFQIGGKLGSSFSGALTSASGALTALGQRAKELERGQADVSRFRVLKTDALDTARKLQEAQGECARLGRAMREAERPTKAMAREFDAAKRKAGDLKEKLAGQNQELHRLRSSLKGAGVSTSNLVGQQNRLARAADSARAAQTRLQATMAKIQANQAKRERMGGAMMSGLGGSVLGGIAAGFAADRLMAPGIDLEHVMAMGGNIANMSRAEIASTTAAIRAASTRTNQDVMGMAAAWQTLLAKGMENEKAVASLTTIGRVATATGAATEDLANTAFTLMDNLKIGADELPRVMDILAQAGKAGSFELRDMAKFFPQLTAGFRALGIQGPEAAASLGAALQVAMKGAANPDEAATNMKNFLSKITSPETIKNFSEHYGINLEKAVKKAMARGENPVEFMLQMIQRITGGDQFRIGELFGDMQVINFLRPMMQNMEEFKKIREEALGAKGVVDTDFARMMETSKEKMKGVEVSARDLAISVSNSLSPAFTHLLAGIRPVINFANTLATSFPRATAAVLSLSGAGLGLGVALSTIGFMGTYAVGGVLALQKAFGILRAATIKLNFAFLANPITWVAAAFVAAAYAVYTYWGPISGFFKGLFLGISVTIEPLMGIFKKMGGWFSWIIEPVKELFGWLGQLLEPADSASAAWFNFGTRVGMVIGNFISSIIELPGKIAELSQSFFDSGAALISTFADGITSRASAAWEAVKGVFSSISDLFPHSDAKTGPLSALTASGRAIIETMATGLASIGGGPLVSALSVALGAARDTAGEGMDVPLLGQPSATGGQGASALGGITINFSPVITVQGNAAPGALDASLRESEDRLRDMIERILDGDRRVSYA